MSSIINRDYIEEALCMGWPFEIEGKTYEEIAEEQKGSSNAK